MTEQTLQEFIDLWEQEFGEQIERGDAEVRAKQLVKLVKHLVIAVEEQHLKRMECADALQEQSAA